jgi:hypothetical protein
MDVFEAYSFGVFLGFLLCLYPVFLYAFLQLCIEPSWFCLFFAFVVVVFLSSSGLSLQMCIVYSCENSVCFSVARAHMQRQGGGARLGGDTVRYQPANARRCQGRCGGSVSPANVDLFVVRAAECNGQGSLVLCLPKGMVVGLVVWFVVQKRIYLLPFLAIECFFLPVVYCHNCVIFFAFPVCFIVIIVIFWFSCVLLSQLCDFFLLFLCFIVTIV